MRVSLLAPFLLSLFLGQLSTPPAWAGPIKLKNTISPWNKERARRPHTRYIILHTTEGAGRGALAKLRREGEAHYLVRRSGLVHRIIDKHRIATHAGRSMWNGHQNLDEHAIGIEIVGYHNRPLRRPQYNALKELIRQLQDIYQISDDRVLTHSMVAYGNPNRWHRHRHRGRKRCAMNLAADKLRRQLGLTHRPKFDPDVKAGRLIVADKKLYRFLFGRSQPLKKALPIVKTIESVAAVDKVNRELQVISRGLSPWDIAREDYNSPSVEYLFPGGSKKRGDQIKNWGRVPKGTKVRWIATKEEARPKKERKVRGGIEDFRVIGKHGSSVRELAGVEYDKKSTIYFFPDGLIRTGAELKKSKQFGFLLKKPPKGTKVLVGYLWGGYVTGKRPPSVICGSRWNYPSTFYRLPGGKIVRGDRVRSTSIPRKTLVFFRA